MKNAVENRINLPNPRRGGSDGQVGLFDLEVGPICSSKLSARTLDGVWCKAVLAENEQRLITH